MKHWAATWTSLDLTFDSRGVPPGLDAFMRSPTALAEVTLRSAGKDASGGAAVHQALTVAPAVHTLTYYSLRPTAFPLSLTHLTFGHDFKWTGGELDHTLELLQLLPSLQQLSIVLKGKPFMSKDRLSHVQLPSLRLLDLCLLEFKYALHLNLSWLWNWDRIFDLKFTCYCECTGTEQVSLAEELLCVLQPTDSLSLIIEDGLCEDVLQLLSVLELYTPELRVPHDSRIDRLPGAEHTGVCFWVNAEAIDYAEQTVLGGHNGDAPAFSTSLAWAAVRSASSSFEARLEYDGGFNFEVWDSESCYTQLHMSGPPQGPSADPSWQSIAESGQAWSCTFDGWRTVTGMPAATSQRHEFYQLKTQAAVDDRE